MRDGSSSEAQGDPNDTGTASGREADTAMVGRPEPIYGVATSARAGVGRYVIVEEIGRGGMGRVLRAYDPKLQREVALKEVGAADLDEEGHARLVFEARAMAKLSHANVVAVYDVEELEVGGVDRLVLVMEHVAGTTLSDWIRGGDRQWHDVVQRFVAAGRGLAAAHAAGLLHRDFKPGNVLVGRGGVVKVTDFGIAKPGAGFDSLPGVRPPLRPGTADGDPESGGQTYAGIVLGTPRYMAPEQHRGGQLSAAADQYAFCVGLWEALCGAPPFSGKDLAERKNEGPPAWSADAVPRRIVEALRRGLAPEPQRRWPDLGALLDALSFEPARRRARWMAGAGVLALVAMVGGSWSTWASGRAERCAGAEEHLAGIWDPDQRAALRSSVLSVDADYAAVAWSHADETLQRYAASWVSMHTEACEATTIRQEQSTEAMDLRMACLHRSRQELEAAITVIMSGEPKVVRRSHRVVGSLPPLSRCADLEALRADVEPPAGDDVARVERARALLALAAAERSAGRYRAAQTALENAETILDEGDYEPARTEVRLFQGVGLASLGEYDAAEAALLDALRLALRWKQTRWIRDAAMQLMSVVGTRLAKPHLAAHYGRLARGLIEGDPRTEATLLGIEAHVHLRRGEFVQAEELYRAALARMETVLEAEDPDLIGTRSNLVNAMRSQGKLTDAASELHQILELRTRVLGPSHPDIAASRSNLANVLSEMGQLEEARTQAEGAVALGVAVLGPEHPDTAGYRFNLANVLFSQGDYVEAENVSREALEIALQAYGPSHPVTASARTNVGNALWAQGRLSEAEAVHRRVVADRQAALGPEHPQVGDSLTNLAAVLHARERFDDAFRVQTRALKIWEDSLGTDHPDVARAQHNLAYVLVNQGEFSRALAFAERAWRGRNRRELAPQERAETAFVFAQARWGAMSGAADRAAARDLAQQALEIYRQAGKPAAGKAAGVQAWLDAHPGP